MSDSDLPDKQPVGAPRTYNRKMILLYLLEEMSKGTRCLERIIEEDVGMPNITAVYDWIGKDTDESKELSHIFSRAQELWCRAQIRKTIEIADDETRDYYTDLKGERKSDNTAVGRDRNRIMARQWAMAKLAPKIFGDKVQTEHSGEIAIVPVLNYKPKSVE